MKIKIFMLLVVSILALTACNKNTDEGKLKNQGAVKKLEDQVNKKEDSQKASDSKENLKKIIGLWSNGQVNFEITKEKFKSNGKELILTGCKKEKDKEDDEYEVYTLLWDEDDYKEKHKPKDFNPQPIILKYNIKTGLLTDGVFEYFREHGERAEVTLAEKNLIGVWKSKDSKIEIQEDNNLIYSGEEYLITKIEKEDAPEGKKGKMYTIYWDEEAYKEKYKPAQINPQPFIFFYDDETQTINDGNVEYKKDF